LSSELLTTFEITGMVESDVPAVLALLEQNVLPTFGVRENVTGFLVARAHSEIVGSAGLETYGACALLRSVAVTPARRTHGVGSALVQRLLARARRSELVAVYLLTTSAQAYFERFDFQVCPRAEAPNAIRGTWEFRTGCPDSAIFMRAVVVREGA
jgi:amino-acid N-acetyltransferase